MSNLPKLNVVIANNFGHLPMFVGAEKSIFEKHGMKNIGYTVTLDNAAGEQPKLVYMLAHRSREAAQQESLALAKPGLVATPGALHRHCS